jgi:hypothetical protein
MEEEISDMDLFEYILETMNYNLYTEDCLYESIDIKKIGSNIKEYIVRFFSWLRKKITEAFEKLKSKFTKKGSSSNDKKDLPTDDEILKTDIDNRDIDDDEKENERQEEAENQKKENETKERIERERDDATTRSLINQIKKESIKKVEKERVMEMVNDLRRIQEYIKKKGGFDKLTKSDIFSIRSNISDLKRNINGYARVGGKVKAKRHVDDKLKMISIRLSTIMSNNTHNYLVTDLDNLEDIINECSDIIEEFQDKATENIEKLSEYISSTNQELDELLSRADKRISEKHAFKTEEDLIMYTEKFKTKIIQDLNRDQSGLENRYKMMTKISSGETHHKEYNEREKDYAERSLKPIEASINMYAKIYKVVVQIVPYAKLKEDE